MDAGAAGARRSPFRARQDRIRDPSLTVLLILELAYMFVAAPLAAKGLPFAHAVGETLVFALLVVVVLLSHRRGAIAVILLGLAGTFAGLVPAASTSAALVLARAGNILLFCASTWVVAHSVYAPGRITSNRLQGAVVVYLNIAAIFASAYRLIWEIAPGAFAGLSAPSGAPSELAAMLYFSLTTLTTTGYGDVVPIDPFARSLANLESVIGQFYLAVTVARLVTLELASRRRGMPE